MSIRILPDEIASQIAAGEVIERPASVVKELIENALDAGAKQVSVHVEGAGKGLIEVADDGNGIAARELPLAVARHATSKLRTAEDLFRITTLGFRGEALASIGSVARLTITSCQADETSGARFVMDGGRPGEVVPTGAPVGTVVKVEDLFFNVPARLKFLKQDSTERQQIDGLVTRYALAYPSVRFQLTQDGRATLQTSGKGDRREVLASLYGVEVARQLLEVIVHDEEMDVAGYISPLSLTRSNRREITFFVNGRWVQDVPLTTALVQAYHTLLMVGRFPLAALFLKLPPEAVDVNVHPAKAEVRFRQPDRVFSGVQRAVRRALLAYSPVPSVVPASTWSHAGQIDPGWDRAGNFPPPAFNREGLPGDSGQPFTDLQANQPTSRLPLLRLVGQVGATYIVAEGPDGLYLIDQHAAHERILFEKFMARGAPPPAAQILLEPATVHLSPQAGRLLGDKLPLLSKSGFQIEPFGPGVFLVRAIPAFVAGSDPDVLLRSLVEDFEEDERPLQAEEEARLIARICKRAAVKGGKILSVEEQRALLANLEACASPRTCPHGRPTMIHLSADLLERQFGRKGAR